MTLRTRDLLDEFNQDTLIRLMRERGLPPTRANEDRRKALAHSFRGDLVALLELVTKQELVDFFARSTFYADGREDFHLPNPTKFRLDELRDFVVKLADDGGAIPAAFKPLEASGAGADSPPEHERTDEEVGDEPAEAVDVSTALDALLPSWLSPLDNPSGSRDPLGLQAIAARYADRLLPGLSVFTSRARYYAFLCWAIDRAQADPNEAMHVERYQRLERLLVLCETLYHAENEERCRYIGWRRGAAFVRESDGARDFELPTRILKNPTSSGALRLYRASIENLELVTSDELAGGLGIRLTSKGEQLARAYGRKLEPFDNWIEWALAGGVGQKKRRDKLVELGSVMCLSSIAAGEQSIVAQALFGRSERDASESAAQRRGTLSVLRAHELVPRSAPLDEIAPDDGMTEAESDATAGANETRGNWAILRAALEMNDVPELRLLQQAAAYEILTVALSQIFASIVTPVLTEGRMAKAAWLASVVDGASDGFASLPAAQRRVPKSLIDQTEELLGGIDDWRSGARRGVDALISFLRSARLVELVADAPAESSFVGTILELRRSLETTAAAALLATVVDEMMRQHRDESLRKGKGYWVALEAQDFVRGDRRVLRPLVHSMRLVQLQSLVADLGNKAEEVFDEA